MPDVGLPPMATLCPACETECAPGLLACPACGRLVHSETLKRLADDAERATLAGDLTAALGAWRDALELLPPATRQHEAIVARVDALSRQVDAAPRPVPAVEQPHADPSHSKGWTGGAGAAGLGTVALMVWKFKFLAVMVLTKGKLLLLGLTKGSTFVSMLVSLGAYWVAFGWRFALGLIVSIYIHEMGHVAALLRYGVRAQAPMFLPGLGAFIRAQQKLADVRQNARVGLAGPIWGLGAALAAYGIYLATGWLGWAAVARLGAVVNLLNLTPIWQLDGARGFSSMTRHQRWLAGSSFVVMGCLTEEWLLFVPAAFAVYQALRIPPAREPDRGSTLQFIVLVVVFSTMTMIRVPMP